MYEFLTYATSTNRFYPHVCFVYKDVNTKFIYISNINPYDKELELLTTFVKKIGYHEKIDINDTIIKFNNDYYKINKIKKKRLYENGIIELKFEWRT